MLTVRNIADIKHGRIIRYKELLDDSYDSLKNLCAQGILCIIYIFDKELINAFIENRLIFDETYNIVILFRAKRKVPLGVNDTSSGALLLIDVSDNCFITQQC